MSVTLIARSPMKCVVSNDNTYNPDECQLPTLNTSCVNIEISDTNSDVVAGTKLEKDKKQVESISEIGRG